MKFLLPIVCFAWLLSSCRAPREVSGLYGVCDNGYLACSQVYLKPDSTFEYYVFLDVGGASIFEGTWTRNHDTILLHERENLGIYDLAILQQSKISGDSTPIALIMANDTAAAMGPVGVGININDSEELGITDFTGTCYSHVDSIFKIEISYLGHKESIEIIDTIDGAMNIIVMFSSYSGGSLRTNSMIAARKGLKILYDDGDFFLLEKASMDEMQWTPEP